MPGFDESLLEPVAEAKTGFDPALLTPEGDPTEPALPPLALPGSRQFQGQMLRADLAEARSPGPAEAYLRAIKLPGQAADALDAFVQPPVPPSEPGIPLAASDQAKLDEAITRTELLGKLGIQRHPRITGAAESVVGATETMRKPSMLLAAGATVAAPEVVGPLWAAQGIEGIKETLPRIQQAREEGDRAEYYKGVFDLGQQVLMTVGGAHGAAGEFKAREPVILPRAAEALAEEPGAEPPATAPEPAPAIVPPEPAQPAPSAGAQPEVPDALRQRETEVLPLRELPRDRPQVDPQIRLGAQGESPPAETEVPAKAEDVSATAPGEGLKPDWKVIVQEPRGEDPGYVQIVDPKAPETSGAIVPPKGSPDFSRLPTGSYTVEEATRKLDEQAKAKPAPKPNTGIGSPADEFGAIYGPKLSPETQSRFAEQVGESFNLPSPAGTTTTLKVKQNMLWVEVNRRVPGAASQYDTGVAYMHIRANGETVLDASKHGRDIDKMAATALMDFLNKTQGERQAGRPATAELPAPAAPAEAPTPPAEAQAKTEAPKRPPAKIPTEKEIDLAGTHYESALRLYGPQNRETQRRHSRYIELTLERKEGLAAKKAAATKPPPEPPTTPGPGAATRGAGPYPAVQQLTDQLNATPPVGVKSRIAWGERIADKWATGKDVVTRSIGHVVNVTQTLRGIARGVRSITDLERKHGEFDFALQKSSSQSFEAGRALERQMPNVADREAAALLIDSGGNTAALPHALDNLPAGTKPSVRRALERAVNPSPELVQFTEGLKQYYGIREQDAKASDLFEDGLRDYYTHIWKKEGNMPDSLRGAFASGKVQTYFQFARQRTIPTFLEGILAGKTPLLDPAQVVPFYNFAMDRSIASRELVRALSEVTASDGRPLADVAGVGATVDPGTAGDPTVFIRPKSSPEAIRDYKTIDNPAMQKWKWKAQAPDGTPIILKGELHVHPEAYERLARLMDKSRLTPTTLTRLALKVGSEVKALKFGTLPSPFHVIHVGSHALLHWTNPFSFKGRSWIEADTGAINWDHPLVREAVEKGHLRIGISPGELSIVAEGLGSGSWARKVPIVGEWGHAYTRWTFQDYIPKLKLATYENALNRARWAQANLGLFKGLSDEQLIARAGDAVNNAYGELNHAFIGKAGRDPRLQRFLRFAFLAPDFGEARLRFAGKFFTRYGHEEHLAFATLAMTAYIAARISNQVSHGDAEWSWRNALRVKVGDKWWSMRSVMGDIIHAVSNPRQFLYVRLNPATTQRAWDAFAGRDVNTGRKLSWKDGVERAAQTVVPIQFGGLTREDQTFMDGFAQSFGFSPQRDTPEQDIKKLAADWRSKNGLGSPEEFVPNDSPSYQRLRSLIRVGADHRAAEMIGELRKTHSDKQIEKAMSAYLHHPFTGSKEHEAVFMSTLTPEQQRLYYQAREEEIRTRDQFYKLLSPMLK